MQPQLAREIETPESDQDLYMAAQLEVDLGARSLSNGNAEVAMTMFQSALQKIDSGMPFHDQLAFNLLASYKMLIEQKLASGDARAAEGFLQRALKLELSDRTAGDDSFRQQFAGVADAIGLIFFRHGDFDASLQCTRRAISIMPSPGFQVNLENALRALRQNFAQQRWRHLAASPAAVRKLRKPDRFVHEVAIRRIR